MPPWREVPRPRFGRGAVVVKIDGRHSHWGVLRPAIMHRSFFTPDMVIMLEMTMSSPGNGAAKSGRTGQACTRIVVRIGASDAPSCVVVAKGDDDLPPHNALRFCHSTPEVNGFALSPPRRASGPPLR